MSHCDELVAGDFDAILNRTGDAGSDGGGGPDGDPRTRRVIAGAAVFDSESDEVAILFSQVPGRQSVPRAELWGLLHVLRRMQPNRHYTMYIDASYVINGMNSRSNHYSQGTNGDLWTLTYTELDRLGSPGVKCVKVKSHVTDGREWTIYNMTARGLVLNELADGAVEEGTGRISRSTEAIAKDGEQCFTAKRIALRLAAIESSIWKAQDERKQYQGSDFSKLYRKQAESIKRKLEDAVESTNGINGHSVYEYVGWTKCRNCPCKARPSNPDY